MAIGRSLGSLLFGLALATQAVSGQTYTLSESFQPGQCFAIQLETQVSGKALITQEQRTQNLPIKAHYRHTLQQRILDLQQDRIDKVAHWYAKAQGTVQFQEDTRHQQLDPQHQLIIWQRSDNQLIPYHPRHPLTTSDYELIGEHFDLLHLAGLLPEKPVSLGSSWQPDQATVQYLCNFDGLIEHSLQITLKSVKDGIAHLAITGEARGIELGATISLQIRANASYDLLQHRLTRLDWHQHDQRDAGPVTPRLELDTEIHLQRTPLREQPHELTDLALVGVPRTPTVPGLLRQVRYADPQGTYRLIYHPNWHLVSQTEDHLVLRFLRRGKLLAQATITRWPRSQPGEHISVQAFRQVIDAMAGWVPEQIIEAGELPSETGWIYRFAVRGQLHGLPVQQHFFAVAGANGQQVLVSFTCKPEQAAELGTADVELIHALTFPELPEE